MTVQQVYDFIDSLAPFASQASFDNAGLLVGDPKAEVTGIHVAMDVTQGVIREAIAAGANLLITHHPMMIAGTRTLRCDDMEGRLLLLLAQEHISLIAAHTNLDQAPGGINEVLAAQCGLTDVTGEGYWRMGQLPEGMTMAQLPGFIAERLHTTVRVMGAAPEHEPLSTMVVASGAGSGSWEEALRRNADVFLTGEMKHHHALALVDAGIIVLECGHFATEVEGIFALGRALQNHMDAVQ